MDFSRVGLDANIPCLRNQGDIVLVVIVIVGCLDVHHRGLIDVDLWLNNVLGSNERC